MKGRRCRRAEYEPIDREAVVKGIIFEKKLDLLQIKGC